jgi:predicted HAD superfamily Cof-like phosphohydrolase
MQEGWNRVHAANMQKVKGTQEISKRNSPYDVVKPKDWTPPDLSDLV